MRTSDKCLVRLVYMDFLYVSEASISAVSQVLTDFLYFVFVVFLDVVMLAK